MPGFDGTGPVGVGPMTGGGRGWCAVPYGQYNAPGYAPAGTGRAVQYPWMTFAPDQYMPYPYAGVPRGVGRGGLPWGGGRGRCWGGGRGFRGGRRGGWW